MVGGAVVRAGQVLASRRTEPPRLAGLWEFPGGKVEPGEGGTEALVRECREELAVEVVVGSRLVADVLLNGVRGEWVLKVWTARIVSGEVRLVDHSDARWLSADELDTVPWIEADAPLVDALRRLLTS